MNARVIRTIFFKELLDTFRDRRTIIAMVGVPVLLYPALFLLAAQVTLIQRSKMDETISRIGVTGEDASRIEEWLGDHSKLELIEFDDPEGALASGELDAVVRAEGGVDAVLAADGTVTIEVAYDAAEPSSREASNRVEDVLLKVRAALLEERVAAEGLAESFAKPLSLKWENVAPPSKSAGSILGSILPVIMVIMLGVGAFYPAVDLTAGEKERGTFETLLSTPTSKLEIVFGKFLAVFTLSLFTGLLNLASMIAVLVFQLTQILAASEQSNFNLDLSAIPPGTIFVILLILIPLALFISAMMMTVALLARSFKEAQNYVTPFFLAIILPASIVAIPGTELSAATQFLPVGNVSLLFRDLMMGKAGLEMIFVVFLSTAVYALMALVVATWIFQREEVILSEESGIPITLRRSTIEPRDTPTLGTSLGIFAVIMVFIFYAGSYVQTRNLHSGLVITQFGLILAPILFALWYMKADFVQSLNLRRPNLGAIAATLLMAPAWVVISIQAGVYHNKVLPAPPELLEVAEKLFDIETVPGGVWGLLFIVALSPAICEEALFRGVIVAGFRKRLPQWAVILGVGILFGLFHLSIYRLVPTALTGIFFTYLAVRTGSIFLPVAAHFVLNGLSILIETGNVPGFVIEFLENGNIDEAGLPLWLIAGAAGIFAAGLIVLEITRRKDSA